MSPTAQQPPPGTDEHRVKAKELLDTVKRIFREGNARRIIIKNEAGQTYLEIPVAVGLVGVLVAPVLAALGAMAALATDFTIEVVRKEDTGPDSGPEQEP